MSPKTTTSTLRTLTGMRSVFRRLMGAEDGVAFITFGVCIALLLFGLLTFTQPLTMGYGWQTEARSKLEEYSISLTKEYTALWTKLNNCKNGEASGAVCENSADKEARVFADKNLTTYASALETVAGKDSTSVTMQTMKNFLEKSVNDGEGSLKFQGAETTEVSRECRHNFQMLTYTLTAPQFNYYWSTNDKEIKVSVSRLTSLPCATTSPETPSCTGASCSPVTNGTECSHNLAKTEYTSSDSSAVGLSSVHALANFVLSLDATSEAAIGDDKLQRLSTSLYSNYKLVDAGTRLAAGLTIGNFPMMGGGAPDCATKGSSGVSGLEGSGSCYDVAKDFTQIKKDNPAGIPNTSRKTSLSGEFIAQHTRTCPAANRVWTYETTIAGSCYERGHSVATITLSTDSLDAAAVASLTSPAATPEAISAACSANPNNVDYVPGSSTHVVGANGSGNSAECADASDCYRHEVRVQCITKNDASQTVYSGSWYQACKSAELASGATSASGGYKVDSSYYRSPASLVRFKATLVADLDGNTISAATPAVTLTATPTAGARAKTTPASGTEAFPEMKADDLNNSSERTKLRPLHLKNTERQFYWACDKGPRLGGATVANNGNLSAPYGDRYSNSRELLDNASPTSPTATATAANGGIGCSIPAFSTAVAASGGAMNDTLDGYDLTFTREGCSGDNCDVPEGLYSVTIEPQTALDNPNTGATAASGSMLPTGGLTTSWRTAANDVWAWENIANVSWATASSGSECPRTGSCIGGWITGSGGNTYCAQWQYQTVQYNNSGTCGPTGALCPNIAKYILNDSDTIRWLPAEQLNIGAVAFERRMRKVSGAAVPYQCMLDRASGNRTNTTGVTVQDGSMRCDWKNGSPFYCATGDSTDEILPSSAQAESAWGDGASGNKQGAFTLNPSNFSGAIQIGDAADHYAVSGPVASMGGPAINFRPRNLEPGVGKTIVSPINAAQSILPLQVQALEPVHLTNSDYAPDNLPLINSAAQVEKVLGQIGGGYSKYDVLPWHNGSQCALMRAGARALWAADTNEDEQHTKVLVYIGAMPTKDDIAVSSSKVLSASMLANHTMGSEKPGTYDSAAMKLKSATTATSYSTNAALQKAFIDNCIYESFKRQATTTPFIITGLPASASRSDYEALADALEEATATSSAESCKRPYCILSDTEGGTGGDAIEGVMTPETCAAKLWKCISPPATK